MVRVSAAELDRYTTEIERKREDRAIKDYLFLSPSTSITVTQYLYRSTEHLGCQRRAILYYLSVAVVVIVNVAATTILLKIRRNTS